MATKLIRRVTTEVFEEEIRRPRVRQTEEDIPLERLDDDDRDEVDTDEGEDTDAQDDATPKPKRAALKNKHR